MRLGLERLERQVRGIMAAAAEVATAVAVTAGAGAAGARHHGRGGRGGDGGGGDGGGGGGGGRGGGGDGGTARTSDRGTSKPSAMVAWRSSFFEMSPSPLSSHARKRSSSRAELFDKAARSCLATSTAPLTDVSRSPSRAVSSAALAAEVREGERR